MNFLKDKLPSLKSFCSQLKTRTATLTLIPHYQLRITSRDALLTLNNSTPFSQRRPEVIQEVHQGRTNGNESSQETHPTSNTQSQVHRAREQDCPSSQRASSCSIRSEKRCCILWIDPRYIDKEAIGNMVGSALEDGYA